MLKGLQKLSCFTLATPDIDGVAAAYARWFDYVIAPAGEDQGEVSPLLARVWGSPAMAGRRTILLHARTGAATLLRLVELPATSPRGPLVGHGWNAMEVLVEDPYALARDLAGSPFRVVVPPRPLPFDADLHAMQVIGPAGELLYMTALPANKTILDLTAAQARVDRPFIAILGVPDIEAALSFYERELQTPVIAPTPTLVQIINEQFALPADHRLPLGIVKLPRDALIEVDGLPATARPRERAPGELSAGFAMVTFGCADLDALSLPWRHSPVALPQAPYRDRRVAVAAGPAGEWIELIEVGR